MAMVKNEVMDDTATYSQLLSSSPLSTPSLPSLNSQSSAESDAPPGATLSALASQSQEQEMPPTIRKRPTRPFRPFFRGSAIALSLACLRSVRIAAAAALERSDRGGQHRRLEDEWTGEWNGEWTANQDDAVAYECGDNCNDDNRGSSGSSSSGMWLDNDGDGLTPDQIITYVSVGIVSFMALLCCMCYPEIMIVTFKTLCGCCCGGGGGGAAAARGGKDVSGGEDQLETDYVGGAQEKGEKKKKKKRKSTRSSSGKSRRSSSRSRSDGLSNGLELV